MASAKAGSKQTSDKIGEMKIALVGKTGCGKSATANTILGRKEFDSKSSSASVTIECKKASCEVDGSRVTVVDTPGLFDTKLSNEEVMEELKKCITYLAPGPHVFLMVLQIGRFTPEEKHTVEIIKTAFGKGAEKYILVLFTRGDDLENDEISIEKYLRKSDPDLKKLLNECGNRVHVFKNREKDRSQVVELLEKINDMVEVNGGSHYDNKMLKEAEEAIEKEKKRIMKAKKDKIKKKKEEIERKYLLQIEQMKQQGESMKDMVVQLQKDQAEKVQGMMQKYEEQARRQAEQSRVAEEARREESRKDMEIMMLTAQLQRNSDPCTIS